MSCIFNQDCNVLMKKSDVVEAQTIIGEDCSQDLLTPYAIPPLHAFADQKRHR